MKTWSEIGIEITSHANSNGDVKVKCPKCGTGSSARDASANVQLYTWHCFKCGESGSLLEPGEGAAPKYGAPLVAQERSKKEYTKPEPIKTPEALPANALKWFTDRAISLDVVRDMKIGVGVEWMPVHEKEVPTIQFPYYNNGELINIKYRGPDKTDEKGKRKKSLRMVTGAELIFYNVDSCRGMAQVAIVEGEPDTLACLTAGISAVMSVPNGAPNPPKPKAEGEKPVQQFPGMDSYIKSAESILNNAETVMIATDTDIAGNLLAEELARRIGRRKCFRVSFPDDCKDSNEVLQKYGAERLRQCFADANPWPIEGVILPSSLRGQIILFRDHGLSKGVDPGFKNLEEHFRPVLGQFTTVTGVPSSGKSAFVNHLAINLMRIHGWRVAICSPESWPPESYAAGLLEVLVGAPIRQVRGYEARQPMSEAMMNKGLDFLDNHVSLIMPDEITTPNILGAARELVMRDGVQLLIVDPFTEILTGGTKLPSHEWIGEQISIFRQFGRDTSCHILMCAHPTKMQKVESLGGGKELPVVGPYDIAGSANWANKSDNIISIRRYPDDPQRPTEAHVLKVRHRDNGQPGTSFFNYDVPTRRYTPVLEPETETES